MPGYSSINSFLPPFTHLKDDMPKDGARHWRGEQA